MTVLKIALLLFLRVAVLGFLKLALYAYIYSRPGPALADAAANRTHQSSAKTLPLTPV